MTRTRIGTIHDLQPGETKVVQAEGRSMLLARVGSQYYAVENRCSHLPLPLSGGKLEECVITCPFHNSRFDVRTGENLDWVTGVVGIKTPGWSRRLLALGRQPQGLKRATVVAEADDLFLEW